MIKDQDAKIVVEFLAPYMEEIEGNYKKKAHEFDALWATDHEPIGKVLKAHLVIENYINAFLPYFYKIDGFSDLRLSFAQKAKLLPEHNSPISFVKKAIIELNLVRNKFGHRLNHVVKLTEIQQILSVLKIAREKIVYDEPIVAIEAFVPIACTFLSITPERIAGLFEKAFSQVMLDSELQELLDSMDDESLP